MAIEPIKGFYVHDEVTDTDGVAKVSVDAYSLSAGDETPSMTAGQYVANSGAVGTSSAFALSDYIELAGTNKPARVYSGFANGYGIAYYNASKTFISMQNVSNEAGLAQWVTLEPPTGAIYFRFDTLISALPAGSVLVDYAFNTTGALERVGAVEERTEAVIVPHMTDGKYVNISGTVAESSVFSLSEYLPTAIVKRIYSALAYQYPIAFYDEHYIFIGVQNEMLQESAVLSWYEVDAPTSAKYLRFNNFNTVSSVTNVQVEIVNNTEYISEKSNAVIGADIAMFENVGLCGDSFTRCDIYTDGGVQSIGSSWGKVIERMRNIDVSIYAHGGITVKGFLTMSNCLPKLLNEGAKQLYILCLGLNDYQTTIGTISDITSDYTQNPDTFYGNYARLIEQIQNYAPNAKIIICKTFLLGTVFYDHVSDAIANIAAHYSLPLLETANSPYLASPAYIDGLVNNHPTAVQQSGMALAMLDLIGETIADNTSYFNDFYIAE